MCTPVAPDILHGYFKKLDYHLWYGLALLAMFFSYGPVINVVKSLDFFHIKLQHGQEHGISYQILN